MSPQATTQTESQLMTEKPLNSMNPIFELSVDEPIRIANPREMDYAHLQGIYKQIEEYEFKDLLKIREKTYDVLDRMDEILLEGGQIPVEQIDDIIRGIAVLEEILIERMRATDKDIDKKIKWYKP